MTNEEKEEYNFHKKECQRLLSEDIKSYGITIGFFKGFFLSVCVLITTALFFIASLLPWIVGAGFGIGLGCFFANVFLDGIE